MQIKFFLKYSRRELRLLSESFCLTIEWFFFTIRETCIVYMLKGGGIMTSLCLDQAPSDQEEDQMRKGGKHEKQNTIKFFTC